MTQKTTFTDLVNDPIFKEAVEGFLRVEDISDIILMGTEGGVRRIIFGDENSLLADLRKAPEDVLKKYKDLRGTRA